MNSPSEPPLKPPSVITTNTTEKELHLETLTVVSDAQIGPQADTIAQQSDEVSDLVPVLTVFPIGKTVIDENPSDPSSPKPATLSEASKPNSATSTQSDSALDMNDKAASNERPQTIVSPEIATEEAKKDSLSSQLASTVVDVERLDADVAQPVPEVTKSIEEEVVNSASDKTLTPPGMKNQTSDVTNQTLRPTHECWAFYWYSRDLRHTYATGTDEVEVKIHGVHTDLCSLFSKCII